MTPETVLILIGIFASALINAVAALALSGVRRDVASLKELMLSKHDATERRVGQVEQDIRNLAKAKGATA